MARRRPLSVVNPDAPPPVVAPKKSLTVEQAARSGDHRELLVAMRDRIALAVSDSDCPPRDLAALTRRLNEIAREIRALDLAAKQEAEESVPADEAFDAASV